MYYIREYAVKNFPKERKKLKNLARNYATTASLKRGGENQVFRNSCAQ